MKYNHYLCSVGLLGFLTSMTSYAIPFIITPQGALPTSITPGGSVDASYTVTNNTLSTRTKNFVRWFPPNVTQVLDPTDPTVCGHTFNLGPHGSINQSCTLKLQISGAVNRGDANPQHHLFVCFPGGKTCAGPTPENSLNVSVQGSTSRTTLSTTVGIYQTALNAAPLAFTSSDNGATWTASPSQPPTTGLSGNMALLYSVGCNGLLCTAAGPFFDLLGNELPFSSASSDGGVTWSAPYQFSINGLPAPANNEILITAISCSNNKCSAVGFYSDNTHVHYPLSYSSSNSGVTWSEPYLPSTTGLPAGRASFMGTVSCSGPNCVAGGFYNTALNERQPLFYRSTDNGVTWSAPIIPSIAGLPPTAHGPRILGVSCSGNNCTAIGQFNNPTDSVPFSYLSSDGGLTWSAPHILSVAALPPGSQGVTLNSISCVADKCVTVGEYKDSLNNKQAVYYTSSDRGVTWSEALIPPTTGIPMTSTSTSLLSVSCIGNICSAVGGYGVPGGGFPLTYYSTNNGVTWTTFLPSIASIPGATGASLFGVGGTQSGVLQT